MRVAALQPGYLPWLGFFEQMYQADVFVIYDEVQYDKRSWRNRNRIRTADGWCWLTVPVLTKGVFTQKITEVRVNNDLPWKRKHWKALLVNYQNTPYFKKYADFFEDVYKKNWEYLQDLDVEIIKYIKDDLGIRAPLDFLSSHEIEGASTTRVVNLLLKLGADEFYNGAAGRRFFDEELFRKNNIRLIYQDYNHPVYKQRFPGFIPHLSIVDLMFNHGPESLDILTGKKKVPGEAK